MKDEQSKLLFRVVFQRLSNHIKKLSLYKLFELIRMRDFFLSFHQYNISRVTQIFALLASRGYSFFPAILASRFLNRFVSTFVLTRYQAPPSLRNLQ